MAQSVSSSSSAVWFVYILECRNGRLYTGITTDIEKRFQKHVSGKGAMFTRRNVPKKILAATQCKNRSEASKLEWAIKQMRVEQKKSLAAEWGQRLGQF